MEAKMDHEMDGEFLRISKILHEPTYHKPYQYGILGINSTPGILSGLYVNPTP